MLKWLQRTYDYPTRIVVRLTVIRSPLLFFFAYYPLVASVLVPLISDPGFK